MSLDRKTWAQIVRTARDRYQAELDRQDSTVLHLAGRMSVRDADAISELVQDHIALFALQLEAVGREVLA